MKLYWNIILQYLGCKVDKIDTSLFQACPFHPTYPTPTLRVTEYPDGSVWCSCIHCGISADIITLVSVVLQTPIQHIFDLFKPGNRLENAIQESPDEIEVQQYLQEIENRAKIWNHIANEHKELVGGKRGRNILNSLVMKGYAHSAYEYIPKTVGIVSKSATGALQNILSREYRELPTLLFPYSLDGRFVGAALVNAQVGTRTLRTYADDGILFENIIPKNIKQLLIAQTELDALAIYTRTASRMSPIYTTVMLGYKLPAAYTELTDIILLNTPNNKLGLKTAIAFLDSRPYSGDREVKLYAINCNVAINSLSIERMTKLPERIRLITWIVSELSNLHKCGGDAAIFQLIAATPMKQETRNLILAAVDRAKAEELHAALTCVTASSPDRRVLLNGNTVHKTGLGFMGIHRHKTIPLSNTTIVINSKLKTPTDIICNCTICVNDNVPPIKARITQNDMTHPRLLQRAVINAYAQHNLSPTVVFYKVAGYSWDEILGKYAETNEVTSATTNLGIDIFNNLHLTKLCIQHDGMISPQGDLIELDPNVAVSYNGITHTTGSAEVIKDLLTTSDISLRLYVLGLCHWLYCATCPKLIGDEFVKNNNHLVYVSRTKKNTAYYLMRTFSTQLNMPMLQFHHWVDRDVIKAYGNLPIIGDLTYIHSQTIPTVCKLHANIISSTSSRNAELLDGRIPSSYISDETTGVSEEIIMAVRDNIAWLLNHLLQAERMIVDSTDENIPAITMYNHLCRLFDVVPSNLSRMVKTYYIEDILDYGRLLSNSIRELNTEGKLKVEEVTALDLTELIKTHGKYTPAHVYIDRENKEVYIRNTIITLLNKHGTVQFKMDSITDLLKDEGYLLRKKGGYQFNTWWVIPLAIWEEKMTPKQLQPFLPKILKAQ